MDWLSLIPLFISATTSIKQIIDVANSNTDIVSRIKAEVPLVANALETYGSKLFPKAEPALHIAAAAMAAYDPNVTKWLQGSLNVLSPTLGLSAPNLQVDGIYGARTRAAVEAVQAKMGLTVDGWAGQITQAAIASALTKKA